jgi:hypothetical protein
VDKRDALSLSIALVQVPPSTLTAVLGQIADLSLAVGTAAVATGPSANPVARVVGGFL